MELKNTTDEEDRIIGGVENGERGPNHIRALLNIIKRLDDELSKTIWDKTLQDGEE